MKTDRLTEKFSRPLRLQRFPASLQSQRNAVGADARPGGRRGCASRARFMAAFGLVRRGGVRRGMTNVAYKSSVRGDEDMVDGTGTSNNRSGRQTGKLDAAGRGNRRRLVEIRRERDLRCYGMVGVRMARLRDLVAINRQAYALRMLSPQR